MNPGPEGTGCITSMKSAAHKKAWYVINGITLYRVVAAPFLLLLVFTGRYELFKWLLLLSFFTDFIDGFLARRYKVTSVLGTKLDSIGDDLTVLVAMVGLFVMMPDFIDKEKNVLILLFILFLAEVSFAFYRYRKMTSFHTYLAKAAAILQGLFLLFTFFIGEPVYVLFYAAVIVTLLELVEEIILIRLLPEWETNVGGLYWALRKKKQEQGGHTV